ncbi:MAG: rRNA pseudouridine synthase [Bdellovibrionales bacterium]|nr:rRNA pseudouridine synthase [Bdellovibrionales bacterium]
MSAERVQKILAHAGIASRRKAEELISQGLVTINGQVAKLGDKAEFGKDAIKVNGKLITQTEELIYVAFNKPKNVISMMADPQGRPNLSDYLSKIRGRLFPIGRLDFSSEGLLLLTNDGSIAEKIQKSEKIPRVYHVKVAGHPNPDMLSRLESGVRVADRLVKPHSIHLHEDLSSKTRVEVVILGSGGDVRALFEMRGFRVDRIVRTAIGHVTLHGLEAGAYRFLKKSQMEAIVETPEAAIRALAEEAEARTAKQLAEKEREARRAGEDSTPKKERVVIGGGKPKAAGARAGGRIFEGAGARPERSGSDRPARPGGRRPTRSFDRKPTDRPAPKSAMKRGVRDAINAGLEPKRKPRSAAGGFGSKKPRSAAGAGGGFGDRKPRSAAGGFGSKKPRSAAGAGGGFGDRKPRAAGGGFGDRKPRSAGGFGSKKPRTGGGRSAGGFGKPAGRPRRPKAD